MTGWRACSGHIHLDSTLKENLMVLVAATLESEGVVVGVKVLDLEGILG